MSEAYVFKATGVMGDYGRVCLEIAVMDDGPAVVRRPVCIAGQKICELHTTRGKRITQHCGRLETATRQIGPDVVCLDLEDGSRWELACVPVLWGSFPPYNPEPEPEEDSYDDYPDWD